MHMHVRIQHKDYAPAAKHGLNTPFPARAMHTILFFMSTRVTTLPNGLRVATDLMPSVETVTLGVWTSAGARNESKDVNGVAHLLEHMIFKGTPTRTAQRIAEEIEDVGGMINAYTSRENTAYYAHVLKDDAWLALDVLADIMQHSTFDEGELERERAVVLQEIGMSRDTPDDIIFDHLQSTAFPDQPVGRPVLGLPEVVGAMGRDALVTYIGEYYKPDNMVIAASGNIDHDRFVQQVQDKFSEIPTGHAPHESAASYKGGDYREVKELEQAHVILGFEGVSRHDDEYYAAATLSVLLGGGMSSRLFQEVREKRGLVYSIYSFHSGLRDAGLFGIYAGTGPNDLDELVPVVCDEVKKSCHELNETELARAKAQLRASLMMARESTVRRCEQLAMQMLLYGHPRTPEEILQRIAAIDLDAVTSVAKRVFNTAPSVAALGPVSTLDDYDAITARL